MEILKIQFSQYTIKFNFNVINITCTISPMKFKSSEVLFNISSWLFFAIMAAAVALWWWDSHDHVCIVSGAWCLCVIEVVKMCWLCVFPTDSGPSGESCGFRADAEACESPHLPSGAAAAENPRSAERHANWWACRSLTHARTHTNIHVEQDGSVRQNANYQDEYKMAESCRTTGK